MTDRLDPVRLAAADRALAEAQQALDILIAGFPVLLATHELTAALMATADTADTQFTVREVELMLACAVAQLARPRAKEAAA